MNPYYMIVVEGRILHTSNDLNEIADKVKQLALKEGEYKIEEHGGWGAQWKWDYYVGTNQNILGLVQGIQEHS